MKSPRAGRIYVAGPMRGYPEHNFPAFETAQALLRRQGWSVVSPVTLGQEYFGNDPSVPGGEYLRVDLRELTDCEAIALLPGWEGSTGARCEVVAAVTMGLDCIDALTGNPIDPPSRVVCNGGYEQPAGVVDSLDRIAEEIAAWQRVTFPFATPLSVATHLAEKAGELKDKPTDPEEIADVFMLVVGAAQACGIDLIAATRAKLDTYRFTPSPELRAIDHLREYLLSTPATTLADGVVRHAILQADIEHARGGAA